MFNRLKTIFVKKSIENTEADNLAEEGIKSSDTASGKGVRKTFEKCGPYIAAFFAPFLVLLVIFVAKRLWPFGDGCFLRSDLYHQYLPFHNELRRKLLDGGSLMYSWNIGGGTDFWALMAYYLASPSSLFLILCPENLVIEFITASIFFKLSACSVTMTYYLNEKHGLKGLSRYASVFFGLFYALSGYTAAYSWNVMWLDCIWLFPLVILGLERLVRGGRGLLYGISYGFCVFTNYYIAIMISVAIACYCAFLLGTEKKIFRDFSFKFAKLIAYTLLGLMLAGAFLIPCILNFGSTASASVSRSVGWESYFSVFDILSRQLVCVETDWILGRWPNIYCGVFFFLGLPLFYLSDKVSVRQKVGYTLLLAFLFLSFSTEVLDYVWHGLRFPNSLPCRQSFFYVLVALTMCFKGFKDINNRSLKEISAVAVSALAFVILAEKLQTNETYYAGNWIFYGSAAFIVLYALILSVIRKGKMQKEKALAILLVVGMVEAGINTAVTSIWTISRSKYLSLDKGVEDVLGEIEEEETFYRAEKMVLRTDNDGAWFDYPSISTFSSVANASLSDLYTKLGLYGDTNHYASVGSTPATLMLQGVKYLISDEEIETGGDESWLELYDRSSGAWIYKNKYALSLGYMIDGTILSSWYLDEYDHFGTLNEFCELVCGEENLFEHVADEESEKAYLSVTVEESGWYYATCYGPESARIITADVSYDYDDLSYVSYVMSAGYVEAGGTITFEDSSDEETGLGISISVWKLSDEKMKKMYEALAGSQMEVAEWTDTKVSGTVTVGDERTLFTTIPASEGWTVRVDGEEVEYRTFEDAYIILTLTPGTHEISFTYETPGLTLGIVMTATAAAIFVLIAIFNKKRINISAPLWKILKHKKREKEV